MFSLSGFSGFLPGLINGLLGTGGGILAVSLLKKQGCSPNEAHATAVGLMLPLSIVSLMVCVFRENGSLLQNWFFVFPALSGSALGAWLLKKIKPNKLRFFFALLILYTAFHILCQ